MEQCDHSAKSCTHDLVVLWQLGHSREVVHEFSGHSARINGLEYIETGVPSQGGQHDMLLISYSADGNVRVWSVADRACLYNLHHPDSASSVLVLERNLLVVSAGLWLFAWDLRNCEEPLCQVLTDHYRHITHSCLHTRDTKKNKYKLFSGDCNADVFEWKLDLSPEANWYGFSVKKEKLRMPKGGPESEGVAVMTCLGGFLFVAVDKVLEQWDLKRNPRNRITRSFLSLIHISEPTRPY
eukprot:TRINITY_DN2710_c0_g1_i1.p1 TRINITY_DN2710_c0_g1~~TRINITY_DN2710_c0_g1_i1.p1  ORF type:complete len:240 (+),score=60.69 TRINITY_DN2710_c0_g1_i1:337-1056(+)